MNLLIVLLVLLLLIFIIGFKYVHSIKEMFGAYKYTVNIATADEATKTILNYLGYTDTVISSPNEFDTDDFRIYDEPNYANYTYPEHEPKTITLKFIQDFQNSPLFKLILDDMRLFYKNVSGYSSYLVNDINVSCGKIISTGSKMFDFEIRN